MPGQLHTMFDNILLEVEYKGKQSNVILTTEGESTLKIFGE
jgi:hypothetical protein